MMATDDLRSDQRFAGNDSIQKAESWARDKYVSTNRKLHRRLTERITEIEKRHQSRPSPSRRKELGQAHYEHHEALVQARVDALLDGFELHRVPITDKISELIIQEAEKLNDRYMASAISDANVAASQGPGARSVLLPIRVPMEGFRCQIEERRAKQKADVSRSSHAPNRKGTIFISCGQFTDAEKALGAEVAKLVEELTPYSAYFAENQSTLEAFTHNILGNIDRARGFIAIMHPRGNLRLLDGKEVTRASVWIEQEIAIAAFAAQILEHEIEIAIYVHADIRREGMREQLLLHPVEFRDDFQVVEDLRLRLPTWRLDDSAIDQRRQQTANAKVSSATDERRWKLVKEAIDKLPDYNRVAVRLLLDHSSLTDYTALQLMGQMASRNSLASVLEGLRNTSGLVSAVPGQQSTRNPQYDLQYEIIPDLKPYVARYFDQADSAAGTKGIA